jgi:hypothetical protein
MKTIKLEVISELPIGSPSDTSGDQMNVSSAGGNSQLSPTIPYQVGQNTIIQTFTALPSANLYYYVSRLSYIQNPITAETTCNCGDVTINIYANNVLFHTVTKEMGGISISSSEATCPCPDGSHYNYTVIVPQ